MFARHGFQNVAEKLKLGRFVLERLSIEDIDAYSAPERMRMAFEQLGPTFIKLGQLLATRPDLIPREFVEEFKKLQSRVPVLPFTEMRLVLVEQFGEEISRHFQWIDEEALAAASIAQVHKAKLASGEDVVLKIQRPGILQTIEEDLSVLYQIAELVEKYIPELRIYSPRGIVDEFFKTLELETDFIVEANNTRRFAESFKNNPDIKIPKVHMNLCGHKVLVMEEVKGRPLSDGIGEELDRQRIVEVALGAYYKMVFKDGFFHGDLHAGNFFVLEDHKIALIDFGVVGRLNRRTQDAVVSMLMALAVEDYDRVAFEYVDLAPYTEGLDVDRFAKDLRDLVAPYYGLTLKNVNVGKLLMDSASMAAKHRIVVPSELMLYFKSMIAVEGLGRQLLPDFDFLNQSLEFAGEVVKDRYNAKRLAKDLANITRDSASLIYDLPRQLRQLVRKVNSPDFIAKLHVEHVDELRRAVAKSSNLLFLGIIIGALLIAGSLSLNFATRYYVLDMPYISAILFALAILYGLVAFYNYLKKP